ncbi:hypothetical protein IGB42_03066 [Andreprevotia sp. IGB-42]|uniref:CNP1-like family protein n=1 Tax=Andreprevotia sp. IGB-42 TaxID=2497473 RepID=UPI0013581ADE|nr:CNP1-like family protein [Andreprevotia sp. IGB-42]KAF0812398.1 hypothetical protein IGB42_03066 [Andreprevotia sp. IGB-42]
MKTKKLLAAVLLALPVCALAFESGQQTQARDPGDESMVGKWLSDKPPPVPVEQAFETPALPSLQQWVRFKANYDSRATTFEIATDSISIGSEDQIVRFAVAVTPKDSTVRNIRYEGIDCATNQARIYAYGTPDNTWQKSTQPWKVIVKNTRNVYEGALTDDLCQMSGPYTVKEIIANLGTDRPDRINTGSTGSTSSGTGNSAK